MANRPGPADTLDRVAARQHVSIDLDADVAAILRAHAAEAHLSEGEIVDRAIRAYDLRTLLAQIRGAPVVSANGYQQTLNSVASANPLERAGPVGGRWGAADRRGGRGGVDVGDDAGAVLGVVCGAVRVRGGVRGRAGAAVRARRFEERSDLDEDEAIALAREELRAARAERDAAA